MVTSVMEKTQIYKDILKLSEQIARMFKPFRIILFGSYA